MSKSNKDDFIDLVPDFILGDISLHRKTPKQLLSRSEYVKFLAEKEKLTEIFVSPGRNEKSKSKQVK